MFTKEKLKKYDVYFSDKNGNRRFYSCLESSKKKAIAVTKKAQKGITDINVIERSN
jgi:hypothetical protein